MGSGVIYTIGYGSRSVEELIRLLQRCHVEYIIDIRSQPYSRFKPEFTKDALQERLEGAGIHYVFMGDTLGGRPTDKSCYVNGKVDYAALRTKPYYQDGIKRLHTALEKNLTIALMCSEGRPQECHRSKLIGETLIEQSVEVKHIDENGYTKTQEEVITELTHGQQTLFDIDYTSRNRVRE